ncbi:DNA utilization protein GntX [Photorhabdus luminescens]|uniref:DNA utilization protein GntX n=2 Tax=Photorhabdus TaxID=29487 RepID=A0A1B8YFT5_9GAMM|nr:competence protein ComF [Photorhabdus luminescens]OCA54031.1 DNA utilization protein GntX [Photorhabdus namnaonensis]QXF31879.1 DNA utilization protein GntX [Photorhabdus akhurstii]PQQ31764.1 DNA utilization protein GntX [Photorhabdus luminescens]PQQ42201.1 DNA utilization protein GntX [Photorhabdus luminescens]
MLTMVGYCWLCRQPLWFPHHGVCSFCNKRLKRLTNMCPCCALPSELPSLPCGRCLKKPPLWENMIAITDYCPPLSGLIRRYKYHSTPQLASVLARLFLLHWQQGYRDGRWHKPNILLSVPLHRHRRWKRGFDQSVLMAKLLSEWLQCDYQQSFLQRTHATLPQRNLSAARRKINLRKAFQLCGPVAGQHVAILDDVITTGATMTEISRLLIRAGARSVQVWAICRTL